MATITQTTHLPKEGDDLLLITQPTLRSQLLRAKFISERSANCIIQHGEHVYLSLQSVSDEAQRREISWAVLRLQMGAALNPQELPDPLRTALLAAASGPSPLIKSLLWGSISGVTGGVLVMALVGLAMTISNVPTESYVGITATAVAFVLAGTVIGCCMTIYAWRRLSRQTAILSALEPPIHPTTANKSK